jgi:4-amino-4-deoxy-L-arabinose transferase-like glycosyltransferase
VAGRVDTSEDGQIERDVASAAEDWVEPAAETPPLTARAPIAVTVLRGLVLAAGAAYLFAFLWVLEYRLAYPYEVEWVGGLVREAVDRVRAGQTIYPHPGAGFLPLLYPPLYYWVTATLARVLGPGMLPLRAVSMLSLLGMGGLLWRAVTRPTGSRFFGALALALVCASYGFTGGGYDLERPDALMLALALVAAVLVDRSRGTPAAALAGVLYGAALLTKQPAGFFVLAAGIALLVRRQRRQAIVLWVTAAAVAGAGFVVLHLRTGGWSSFYVFGLPADHLIDGDLVVPFFFRDLPSLGILVALATVAVVDAVRRRRGGAGELPCAEGERMPRERAELPCAEGERMPRERAERGLGLALALSVPAGAVAAMLSRMHFGGWQNTFAFLLIPLCYAAPVGAHQVIQTLSGRVGRRWPALVYAALLVQMGLFFYDPEDFAPNWDHAAAVRAFTRVVARLEAGGEVWVTAHAGFTRQPHPHEVALWDVVRTTEKKPPAELAQAVREHRFAAIVLDEYRLGGELRPLLQRHYYVAERLALPRAWTVVGLPTVPQWVLRPRHEPLGEATPIDVLERRTRAEMTLADVVRGLGDDYAPVPTPPDAEQMARSLSKAVEGGGGSIAKHLCGFYNDVELCRALANLERTHQGDAISAETLSSLERLFRTSTDEREGWRAERRRLERQLGCLRLEAQGQAAAFDCPPSALPAPGDRAPR